MARIRDRIIITSEFEKDWLQGTSPMTRAEAWIQLLIECNSGSYKKGDEVVQGVCGHSQAQWASKFRWSRGQVRSFFKLLEDNQLINQRTTKSATYIKIMVSKVYEGYQPSEQPTNNQPNNQDKARPKSIAEVKDYFVHLGVPVSVSEKQAHLFWNHYNSKGWVIGKSPMKDWKSACVTWKSNMDPELLKSSVPSMDRRR